MIEYRVFGTTLFARNAEEAMIDCLRHVAQRALSALPAMAKAVQGTKRAHIATRREAIYPGQPHLQRRTAEFSPGYFVGLNVKNQEKLRILRLACAAAGLVFGSDIDVHLPNAC